MAVFKKKVLRSGTFFPRNKKNEPYPVTFTNDDVEAYAKTGTEMLKAGLKIPCPINHNVAALPAKEVTDVFQNGGYWTKFWTEKEGNNVVLWAELDAPGDVNDQNTIAGKIGTTMQEVSICGVDTWTDGTGRKWDHAPLHIAVCNKPVISGQGNFELVDGTKAFSFSMGFTDDGMITDDLIKALADDQTYLPQGVTLEQLPEMLLVSLKQKAMLKMNGDDKATVEQLPVYFSTEPIEMQFTREQADAIVASKAVNPATKQPYTLNDLGFKPVEAVANESLAKENTELKLALSKTMKILSDRVVKGIKDRVQNLINKKVLKEPQVKTIEGQLTAFQMSLTPDGSGIQKSALEEYLDLLEASLANLEVKPEASKPTSMFQFNVEPNGETPAELTAEDEKAAKEYMLRAMAG